MKGLINTNAGLNHAEPSLTTFQFDTGTLVIARVVFYSFLSSHSNGYFFYFTDENAVRDDVPYQS